MPISWADSIIADIHEFSRRADEERERRKAWRPVYEDWTVEQVCFAIRHYLKQFDASGAIPERRYEVGISVNLSEALRRAVERRGAECEPDVSGLQELLSTYNEEVAQAKGDTTVQPVVGALALLNAEMMFVLQD